ncbi:hypothetical protein MTQ13_23600 [Streptomyces sp. XM4011]|uniref:SAVMC3_10250 family protein n=1 Tax=Streptomyces TaxID=1883 RepID=UPI001FF8325D|nr:SAVMC3_10250 family protein [Streptomyces sp. XM4011]MCK1817229.1 hypothetical protein [Streptomyces sp. XM4011]
MDELIYLSERKISQFGLPARGLSLSGRLAVSTPVGGLEFEPGHTGVDRAKRLRRIVRHLRKVAVPHTTPDVEPGQWVEFTARMNHLVPEDLPDAVLFLGLPPEGGGPRLVLHGSADHLRTGHRVARMGETEGTAGGGSSGGGGYVYFVHYLTRNRELRRLLLSQDGEPHSPAGDLTSQTAGLLARADRLLGAETAERVAGYARVTVRLGPGSPYLIGSPLLVRYAR